MTECFLHSGGYYILGHDIEVYRRIYPAMIYEKQVYDPIQHEYLVLLSILQELMSAHADGSIIIYGHTRIVDEMNGNVEPLGPWCQGARQVLLRDYLPVIPGIVRFKKRDENTILKRIDIGANKLGVDKHNNELHDIAKTIQQETNKQNQDRKNNILRRFKDGN